MTGCGPSSAETAGCRKACTWSAHSLIWMRSPNRSPTLCRYPSPIRETPSWLLRAGRRWRRSAGSMPVTHRRPSRASGPGGCHVRRKRSLQSPRRLPWRRLGPSIRDSPAAETPRRDEPRSDRPWLVSHARKVTISAAAVAVFGAALSLTASSALNVENTSAQAGEPAAESAPLTSASPHPVLAPTSAAPVAEAQPLAAPPPAPPARLETIAAPRRQRLLRRPRPFPPPCRKSRYPGLCTGSRSVRNMLPRLGCRPARNRRLRLRCRPLRNLWPRLDYSLSPNRLGHRPGHNRLGHRPGPNRSANHLGHNLRLRLRSLPSLPRRPSLRLLRPPPHRSRRRLRRSLRHQQRRRCPRTLRTRHLHRIRCSPSWGPCSVRLP